ncbi:MAG: hypothetical protein MR851_09920 [[Clostridium] scindens]|uniref:hypothetical protein n=1 Tax=Clostridium scindens (strain JCM 10418 / VPI 12708) TaxID=29347 RepID=UPI00242F0FB2|nr:hypothetical protein [[Clostridium] scindens]MCI6396533.1 hypothetical protein [[Clostridium] scindens]
MGLFNKKYIYVSVCFQNSSRSYAYRTEDKSIKINDVVMVPVPGEAAKPAIVTKVQICTEKDAPYPPDKTKMIIGRADRKTRKLFDGVDMRMRWISLSKVCRRQMVMLLSLQTRKNAGD